MGAVLVALEGAAVGLAVGAGKAGAGGAGRGGHIGFDGGNGLGHRSGQPAHADGRFLVNGAAGAHGHLVQ